MAQLRIIFAGLLLCVGCGSLRNRPVDGGKPDGTVADSKASDVGPTFDATVSDSGTIIRSQFSATFDYVAATHCGSGDAAISTDGPTAPSCNGGSGSLSLIIENRSAAPLSVKLDKVVLIDEMNNSYAATFFGGPPPAEQAIAVGAKATFNANLAFDDLPQSYNNKFKVTLVVNGQTEELPAVRVTISSPA